MGQYFHSCILGDDKKTVISWVYSHDYGSGLKLMEHSYIKNEFVMAFETLIANKPQHVVWAGDYADAETNSVTTKVKLSKKIIDFIKENVSEISAGFIDVSDGANGTIKRLAVSERYNKDLLLSDRDMQNIEEMETILLQRINSINKEEYKSVSVSVVPDLNIQGDVITIPVLCDLGNINDKCGDEIKVRPVKKSMSKFRYIVNHDKKQFVDKTKVPEIKDWEGARLHPLPLLTCEGNGRGGGDFRGEDKRIGMWARDLISIEKEMPSDFEELIFDLAE